MRPSTFLSLVALSLAGFVAAAPTPQGADAIALPVADGTIEPRGLTKAQKEAKKKADAAKAKAAAKAAAAKAAAAKKAADKKKASQPKPPQSLAAGSGAVSTGQATYYYQAGNPGSCGNWNSDNALIVAVNSAQVANGAHCGKYVTITNTANGRQVRALVADTCPSCSWGSLDLSVAAFKQLGSLDQGVLPIKWQFS